MNATQEYNRAHTHHYDANNEVIQIGCPYELQTIVGMIIAGVPPKLVKSIAGISELKLRSIIDSFYELEEHTSILAHFTQLCYVNNNGHISFPKPVQPCFSYTSPFGNKVSFYRVKNCLSLDGYAIYYDVMRLALIEGLTQGHLVFYDKEANLLNHSSEDQEALSIELCKSDILAFQQIANSESVGLLSDLDVIRKDAIWYNLDESGEEVHTDISKEVYTVHGVRWDQLIKETLWDVLTEDSLVHFSPQMAYRHKSTTPNLYKPHHFKST